MSVCNGDANARVVAALHRTSLFTYYSYGISRYLAFFSHIDKIKNIRRQLRAWTRNS